MDRFTEPQMRPPQEAHSLLLRATQGCTYNKCRFCYVSRGYPFLAVTNEELACEAERARPFFPSTTPIYLTGSNPFALPFSRLASWIAVLRPPFRALRGFPCRPALATSRQRATRNSRAWQALA